MSSGLLALLALIAGLAGGYFLGRATNVGVRRSVQLDQELQQARGELDRFRTRVIEHFTTTANLVNRLTSDYRAVHDHLSRGAQQLAGGQVPRLESLAPGEPQLVAPPIVVDELLEEIEEEEGVSARSASPSNRRAAPREGWYEDVAPGTEIPHYAKDDRR
jgi:HPt (histidine-containing phosphotransfer) domain-containing protein